MINNIKMRKNKEQLKQAFQDFMKVPFPDSPDDEELSDLHAGLASYDSYIAGCVSTLVGGAAPEYPVSENKALRKHLEIISGEYDKYRSPEARRLLEYLQKIERLVKIAELIINKENRMEL